MDMLELKIYLRQIFIHHIYTNFRKRERLLESNGGCTAGMVMSLIAIQN
jgi:hypothetical protein